MPICTFQGQVLIVRTKPSETPGGPPGRIYVAMSIAPENTNFGMTEAFVVFMANAVRWLAPQRAATGQWTSVSPVEARALLPAQELGKSSLPMPGIYGAGDAVQAVSLLGLGSENGSPSAVNRVLGPVPAGPPAAAADAAAIAAAVKKLPLPPPAMTRAAVELWPALVIAAVTLWLAGWTVRDAVY
jgi:hypothetical protein